MLYKGDHNGCVGAVIFFQGACGGGNGTHRFLCLQVYVYAPIGHLPTTFFPTTAIFTKIRIGCPHPSIHNSYFIAYKPIPHIPITSNEQSMATRCRHYFFSMSPLIWTRLQPQATTKLPRRWVETVELQAPRIGGGGQASDKANCVAN